MSNTLLTFSFVVLVSFCKAPLNLTVLSPTVAKCPTAANNLSNLVGKGTEIKVAIIGGPNAGSYQVSVPISTCSMGMTGDSSFGNQYSEEGKKDNEMSSVQMIIDNYEAAKRGEDTDFNVTVGFGKLAFGKSYTVKTATGKLKVSESVGGKTVSIEGTTTDGVKLNVVLSCMTTQVMVNGFQKEQ